MPRIYVKTVRVAADAVDVHGHVNNQDYLRWMEEIAVEHSASQGWPMERYLSAGASWYVRAHAIEYLRPAMPRDDIAVYTWIAGMSERTSPRRTLFVRLAERRQILARAETLWTFVDMATGRSVRISDEVRSAFEIVDSEDEVLRLAGLHRFEPARRAGNSRESRANSV
jgi:acyl-CoA thioester hydrolase